MAFCFSKLRLDFVVDCVVTLSYTGQKRLEIMTVIDSPDSKYMKFTYLYCVLKKRIRI